MLFVALAIVAIPVGIVVSAFLMIAAWFSWTSLPLLLRLPIGLFASAPFGLVVAGADQSAGYGWLVLASLTFFLVSLFVVENTWRFVGLLVVQGLLVGGTLLSIWLNRSEVLTRLDLSVIGYGWLVMLGLAGLLSLPRWFGFRLQRILSEMSDQKLDLASGKSIDQWIRAIESEQGENWNHAETMRFLAERGVTADLRKPLTSAIFRLMRKPAPRLRQSETSRALADALQWATTASQREHQFSTRQLGLWITSAAILFACLAKTGISPDVFRYAVVMMPGLVVLSLGILAMATRVLMSHETFSHRILFFVSFAMIGIAIQLWAGLVPMPVSLRGPITIAATIGAGVGLWIWMSFLRVEGFRLIRPYRAEIAVSGIEI
ncbi:MAG: hypothetical protein AB8B91_10370 [Rubripirellula sp.]